MKMFLLIIKNLVVFFSVANGVIIEKTNGSFKKDAVKAVLWYFCQKMAEKKGKVIVYLPANIISILSLIREIGAEAFIAKRHIKDERYITLVNDVAAVFARKDLKIHLADIDFIDNIIVDKAEVGETLKFSNGKAVSRNGNTISISEAIFGDRKVYGFNSRKVIFTDISKNARRDRIAATGYITHCRNEIKKREEASK